MELGESNYALISSPYDSFMRKHLQHYGYFSGRSEIVKKYGFVPSKSQLISSSSNSDSSSDDDEQTIGSDRRSPQEGSEYKGKPFVPDRRIPVRQTRISYNLNFRGQHDEGSFEPRWPIEIEVLLDARIRHINAPPKQPEPFYKPTAAHMPFIRSFDENNGRVVYNYNPETCGYFIRSRIGGNREGCRPAAVMSRNSDDTTVLFESRFESGNLMKAVQVGEFEYELYLRYDLYTKRNTQWFYFRLQNIRANRRYRFTIVNFFKPSSLYSCGMKPLLYSVQDAEHRGIGWRRCGEEIVYYRNNLPVPDSPSSNLYSLTWTCKFPNDNDTYYFAHCYPYTYSDLQDYLNDIQIDPMKSQYCKQKVLCRTLAGNLVSLLTITSPPSATGNCSHTCTSSPEQQVKKGVVVTARVHPGETNASWMMKGLLDFLLSDSADAKLLRDNFIFKIVPMLNPDGVIVGNYRCSLSGRDLNRNYKTILKDAYPSIWHTREMVKRFMAETELVLYCDFHGHSRKQNVFIYGCENKHLPGERLKEKIFPAMLSKNDPSKFSLHSCKFKVQKNKEGTGRVVMWSMGIKNSYTLEATFCGSTQRDRAGHHFTTEDFESIGYHFLDSVLDYCDPDQTKRNQLLVELEDSLRHSIQMRLMSRGINAPSIDDIDLDQWSSDDDSSDDGGSDSSADDGLPKHLEVIAAAKVRLKKPRKKKSTGKGSKDQKRKDENEKDGSEKNKPTGLSLSKSRNTRFPAIDLIESSFLTIDNNESLEQSVLEKTRRQMRRRRGPRTFLVCECDACINARIPRTEDLLIDENSKCSPPPPPPLLHRSSEANNESFGYDGSNDKNNRNNRWPPIPKASVAISRATPSDEKAQRSQAAYYKILARDVKHNKRKKHKSTQQVLDDEVLLTSTSLIRSHQSSSKTTFDTEYSLRYSSMSSCQTNITAETRLVNEPRDAFTATYLLRRLNTLFPMQYVRGLERDSAGTSGHGYLSLQSNPRIDEDVSLQTVADNEEAQLNRTVGANQSDDGRQPLNSFVTNRVSAHLNDRILGISRSSARPKSSSTNNTQNRTILDIKAIQPPPAAFSPRRITDQHRSRIGMGANRQHSLESNCLTSRSIPAGVNERRMDDSLSTSLDNQSSTTSKLVPIRPDNIPINLVSRYEMASLNHLASLNRVNPVRISSMKKSSK